MASEVLLKEETDEVPVGLHYRVAFFHAPKNGLGPAETRYGIVESHTPRAVEHAKLGELVVLDAVYPVTWFVGEQYVQDIPIAPNHQDEYCQYVLNKHIEAAELSESLEGLQKGKLMRFPAGRPGGSAYYVVTRLTKRLAHLEWRGFDMDRCTEPVLGFHGTMNRERAELLIKYEESSRRRIQNAED